MTTEIIKCPRCGQRVLATAPATGIALNGSSMDGWWIPDHFIKTRWWQKQVHCEPDVRIIWTAPGNEATWRKDEH